MEDNSSLRISWRDGTAAGVEAGYLGRKGINLSENKASSVPLL